MGFVNWITSLFGKTQTVKIKEITQEEMESAIADMAIREMAFQTCINRITSAFCLCEFETYEKGEQTRNLEWYAWNREPNQNQNAAAFRAKLISQLYRNNEALVIEVNKKLYVADGYTMEEFALKENIYRDIYIDGYGISETFRESEVLHFKLNPANVKSVTDMMYESYKKLVAYAFESFQKSRGNKGILNISAQAQADQNFNETFEEYMTEYFRKFYKADNAVLPLYDGYTYTDLSGGKTYTNETTRDIKSLIDDVFDFTARAFLIPPELVKGNIQNTEKCIEEMLTFAIDPLARMMEMEINRKRNGLKGEKEKTYLSIDTSGVRHKDIMSASTPIEKLISSGAFTANEIRENMGYEKVNEQWADEHFITKNFTTVQLMMQNPEGGENGEKVENGSDAAGEKSEALPV